MRDRRARLSESMSNFSSNVDELLPLRVKDRFPEAQLVRRVNESG